MLRIPLPTRVAALVLFSAAAAPAAPVRPYAVTEEREACTDFNPLRTAYYGDLHVHTAYSQDASTQGTRNTPRDAYRFAKGEALGIQPYAEGVALRQLQLRRPLDFAAVTDHAELLGESRACSDTGGHSGAILFRNLSAGRCGASYRFWSFPARVEDGPVEVVIKLFLDTFGFEVQLDELTLTVDPSTGQWGGDVEWPTNCTPSPDSIGDVRICWQMGFDRDGDGLLDLWERDGINVDNDTATSCPGCPNGADLDLPGVSLERRA